MNKTNTAPLSHFKKHPRVHDVTLNCTIYIQIPRIEMCKVVALEESNVQSTLQ